MKQWEIVARKMLSETSMLESATFAQYVALVDYYKRHGEYIDFRAADDDAMAVRNETISRAIEEFSALTDAERERAYSATMFLLLPILGTIVISARKMDKSLGKAFERWGDRLIRESRASVVGSEVPSEKE